MSPLEDFLAGQNWPVLERVNGWEVKNDGAIVSCTFVARDGERYTLRCECDSYPVQAPSVVFVDDTGSKMNPRAWPRCRGQFGQVVKLPPNSFLCTNLTREGLHHHPEWRSSPLGWSKDKTLLDVFNLVQRLLCSDDYLGRAGS